MSTTSFEAVSLDSTVPPASARVSGIQAPQRSIVPLARSLQGRLALATDFQRAEDVEGFAYALAHATLPSIFHCTNCAILLVNEARDRLNQVANTEKVNVTWHLEGCGVPGRIWELGEVLRHEPCDPSDFPCSEIAVPGGGDHAVLADPPPTSTRDRSLETSPCHLLAFPVLDGARVVGVVTLTRACGDAPFVFEDEVLAKELQLELGHLLERRAASDRERQFSQALSRLGEVLQQEVDERMALRLLLTAVTCGKGLACNRAALWLSDVDQVGLQPELAVGFDVDGSIHEIWEAVAHLGLDEFLSRARHSGEGALPLSFKGTALRLGEKNEDLLSTIYLRQREGGCFRREEVFGGEQEAHDPLEAVAESVFAIIRVPGDAEHCQGVLYVDNAFDRKPLDDHLLAMLQKFARLGGLALARIREARWRAERAATHERLTSAVVAQVEGKTRIEGLLDALQ
jgi:hypothetical protein